MTTAKEILIEQFSASYDENGWFVAVKNTLNNLTAEQAIWKTPNLDNSIWEIVSHLNYYNFAYLIRFKSIPYTYPASDNDETFRSDETASQTAWRAEVEKFDSIMSELRDLIKAAGDTKFDEAVSATNDAPWGATITRINAHNAYHGGQIVVIRKLQGSWDASKGVS